MCSLELFCAKGGSQARKTREDRGQFGHVSLELWKSPLGSVTCRTGFREKDLGCGCTGAALGWRRLSPVVLAWPGGKAEILMGLLSVDSDSTADPTHEHGQGSP